MAYLLLLLQLRLLLFQQFLPRVLLVLVLLLLLLLQGFAMLFLLLHDRCSKICVVGRFLQRKHFCYSLSFQLNVRVRRPSYVWLRLSRAANANRILFRIFAIQPIALLLLLLLRRRRRRQR